MKLPLMKEALLTLGGCLFGIGCIGIAMGIDSQGSPSPIFILEVFRPTAFYLIFGITAIVGIILLGIGMLGCKDS